MINLSLPGYSTVLSSKVLESMWVIPRQVSHDHSATGGENIVVRICFCVGSG